MRIHLRALDQGEVPTKTIRLPPFRASMILLANLVVSPACKDAEGQSRVPYVQTPMAAPNASNLPAHAPDSQVQSTLPSGCPLMMVRVKGYCIDTYEAHVVELDDKGDEHPHPHYLQLNGKRARAKVAPGVFPQAYLSQTEASGACREAGKRLCTSGEWKAACMGPEKLVFSYGNREEPGRCNTRKGHLLSRLFGSDANRWTYGNFNDPRLDTMPDFLARTGSYDQCVSGFGVHDMVGNLAEWVGDLVTSATEPVPARKGAPPHRLVIGNGIFMGSFFSNSNENGYGCKYKTIVHEPAYHDYSTGFRCCKDSEK